MFPQPCVACFRVAMMSVEVNSEIFYMCLVLFCGEQVVGKMSNMALAKFFTAPFTTDTRKTFRNKLHYDLHTSLRKALTLLKQKASAHKENSATNGSRGACIRERRISCDSGQHTGSSRQQAAGITP